MADRISRAQRSEIMRRVRTKDTAPEVELRQALYGRGYRYRLHVRSLPGRPDIVFHTRKVVIFVNGCFWHGHNCRRGALPKTRTDFWSTKIAGNRSRDRKAAEALRQAGWRVAIVWECQLKYPDRVLRRLTRILGTPGKKAQRKQTA